MHVVPLLEIIPMFSDALCDADLERETMHLEPRFDEIGAQNAVLVNDAIVDDWKGM